MNRQLCAQLRHIISPFILHHFCKKVGEDHFQIELFHEQLPLPVPCYDLFPVTELTVGPPSGETSSTPGSLELTGGEYKT
jgi:hypothetical protein